MAGGREAGTALPCTPANLPNPVLPRWPQGMLWVWMEAGPGAAAASQLRPLPLPAELLSSGGDGATPAGSLLGGW